MSRRKVAALPAQVANQIAAGEVVTRPASVVKELVENAVDAEAGRIVVDIEGGGTTRLSVSDDGHGMDRDDARLALERHATSKIRRAEDLITIESFGFRGEALPSIASVSRLLLRTRPPELDEGTEIVVEGGAEPRVSPCGAAPGTTVVVADLFYNVPARRKFLRAVATEAAHVGEVVRSLALAHPGVGFELVRDGRRSRRYLPAQSRLERAREVLEGYELFACEGARGPARIEAYLSGTDRARTGAGGLHLFVLGRAVQDRALARAVASAFGDALEPGRYPVGAVFVELPRELVDVNVHPQKAEVRFAHARAVADAVYGVVRDALGSSARRGEPAAAWRAKKEEGEWQWREPMASPEPERLRDRPPQHPRTEAGEARGFVAPAEPRVGSAAPAEPRVGLVEPAPVGAAAPATREPHATGPRLVGVARGLLLLCETGRGLLAISRRRARAALVALRARRELAAGRLVSQRLLFPIVRSLDEAHCDALDARGEAAARWGVELRRVGPRSMAIHAVPRIFAQAAHEPLVTALLLAIAGEDTVEGLAALVAEAGGEDDRQLLEAIVAEDLLDAVGARMVSWRELGIDA
jgi:DNA mismatch repair protein MutL